MVPIAGVPRRGVRGSGCESRGQVFPPRGALTAGRHDIDDDGAVDFRIDVHGLHPAYSRDTSLAGSRSGTPIYHCCEKLCIMS